MTREELAKAIREDYERKGVWACKSNTINMRLDFEMLGIILEALEQEPTTKNDLGVDAILRAEVKKIAKEMYLEVANMEIDVSTISDCISYTSSKCREVLERKLQALPSVTPQDPCEDTISRKSIKQKLQEHHDFFVNAYGGFSNLPLNDKSRVDEITNCIAMVVNEPSVTPQEPRKGHWIGSYQVDFGEWQEYDVKLSDGFVTDNCHCSECGEELLSGDRGMFCPYCGSDNREVVEK